MPAPYERMENESPPAFEAFAAYRDMGLGRSTGKVAQALGKSKTLMDKWSSKHRWVKRAAAWDAHVDARTRSAELRALERMRERQIQTSVALQGLGASELSKYIEKSKSTKGTVLKVPELVQLVEKGAQLERLNRGEPGEIVQTQGDADLSGLTMDELKALKNIHRKLREGHGD